jgi:hypothetical protein
MTQNLENFLSLLAIFWENNKHCGITRIKIIKENVNNGPAR